MGGYNKTKVTVPICAMRGGADLQKYLDLLIPAPPAAFKIINGEGTIHLIGSHCVDYYSFKDESEDEDEETEDEMEIVTTAEKGEVEKTTLKKTPVKKALRRRKLLRRRARSE